MVIIIVYLFYFYNKKYTFFVKISLVGYEHAVKSFQQDILKLITKDPETLQKSSSYISVTTSPREGT